MRAVLFLFPHSKVILNVKFKERKHSHDLVLIKHFTAREVPVLYVLTTKLYLLDCKESPL